MSAVQAIIATAGLKKGQPYTLSSETPKAGDWFVQRDSSREPWGTCPMEVAGVDHSRRIVYFSKDADGAFGVDLVLACKVNF